MFFYDLPPQQYTIAESVPQISTSVAERAQAALICARAHGQTVDKLAVFDANLPSSKKRFFLLNVEIDQTPSLILNDWVSHGSGSDANRDGYPERFSNVENSHMTSLGFYRISERYLGKSGFSWRLDGLTPGFNNAARQRAVVMHPARYINPFYVGRSQGCPALRQVVTDQIDRAGTANTYLWIDAAGQGLEGSASLACEAGKQWMAQRQEWHARRAAYAASMNNYGARPIVANVCVSMSSKYA